MTVKKRLIKGLFANGFGQAVNVVIQLASVPLFLSCWGVGLYGEWLVLSAIPVYLSMSDLGFGAVAANEMTMLVAKEARNAALEVFQSVFILIFLLSAALAIMFFAVSLYLPWDTFFHFYNIGHAEISKVFFLLALHVLLGLQISLIEAGFRSDGNYAIGVFSIAMLRLLESLVMFGFVLFGGGVVAAALSFLIVRVIGIIVLRLFLKKLSPWITFSYKGASYSHIKRLAGPAISFMGFPLGNALSMQGMIMVVGANLGASSVVVFSIMRTVSRVALQGMGIINSSFWPELSVAFGKGDIALARKLHRLSCQMSFWISTVSIVCLFVLGGAIIQIWTQGKVVVDFEFFALMMAVIFANSFWFTSSVVHAAINKHQVMAALYLLGSGCALFLATVLLQRIGINGAAIALLSVDCCMILYVVKRSVYLTEDSISNFLIEMVKPPLILRNIF